LSEEKKEGNFPRKRGGAFSDFQGNRRLREKKIGYVFAKLKKREKKGTIGGPQIFGRLGGVAEEGGKLSNCGKEKKREEKLSCIA